MSALVECVPNFSEGRDQAKVEAIVGAARRVKGVAILDVETDADHNRCVLSFVAPPEAALEACFRVAEKSRELIDLNVHKGEHPRMGAVDVIPFIPVSGIDIKGCAALAERLGQRVGRELEIPVYLYDHAARVPERKDLAGVRKGQFEGLKALIGKDASRVPDFGPNRIHPTAGAVAVGARQQIVNFNLNLDMHDLAAGKDIAKRLRASGGGLPCVRGKEIGLAARKQVQISTVLTDYKTTSMAKTLAEARRLAAEHGAKVVTTEIVGLLPRQALVDFAVETLNLENFKPEVQILENRLEAEGALSAAPDWRQGASAVAEALSTTDATPGGGSAAAIAGAMGCGLGMMAAAITLRSKKLEETRRPGLMRAVQAFGRLKGGFERLMAQDSDAFERFMAALALPKDLPERPRRMQEALVNAAEVPLRTAAAAAEGLAEAQAALPLVSASVLSDMRSAAHLLKAAAACAAENVRINLDGIKDRTKAEALARGLDDALKACGRVAV
ncbi:MAG: glutamate formimidoyltransferase [Elusimicrobia bacterium]|nr:glutamate formimidoyltransferase [Elusimicrobiota bacterium]